MRTITHNTIVFLVAVVVGLLALGALPGLVATGSPYHVEAEAVDDPGPAVVVDSERRFPFSLGAIEAAADGEQPARSEAYRTGVVGLKEAFTHTPFDEFSEFEGRNADAVARSADSPVGDIAYIEVDGKRYRLEIVRLEEGT